MTVLPPPSRTLSLKEARRIALAAQGFTRPRPAVVEARHLARMLTRLGLLQIDSVNVLVRSHYLPLFSRLGAYPMAALDGLGAGRRGRAVFEYWGHEASLIPLAHQQLFRWRMARAERGEGIYGGLARFGAERPGFIDEVYAQVRDEGALSASGLVGGAPGDGGWWGWSDGKRALEWLFWAGRVTTARRRKSFERVYDLPERVFAPSIVAAPTPAPEDAIRALLRHAAAALGVATERDLRDYYRLEVLDARRALADLVEAGELLPVSVRGWAQPAYLDADARTPRRVEARALLSPFDSLIWERERTERLFGFHYRLAFYTPLAKRTHGYYVLPFLLGERLVARVDLKADRGPRLLRVLGAHLELGLTPHEVAEPLAAELRRLAAWLDLERVEVAGGDDLAQALRSLCRQAALSGP